MSERTRTAGGAETDPLAGYRQFAWWLDRSIRLPGGFRIGVDGLIGLIPGIGDVVGGLLSAWIVYAGWRAGVPGSVLLRMVGNILLDVIVGSVPILGDLFDFAFKANQRNADLIDRHAPAAAGAR